MPFEIGMGLTLLEAVVGIIKSSSDRRDMDYIRARVDEISAVLLDIHDLTANLHQAMVRRDDPDVVRFETTRTIAEPIFSSHWDRTLLDFASELLAVVCHTALSAVRLVVHAAAQDPETAVGYRHRTFDVTVLASRSIRDNSVSLCDFFNALLDYNDLSPIPTTVRPKISVFLCRGDAFDLHQFDRVKSRISVRLALLSTLALGWRDDCLGTLVGDNTFLCKKDKFIFKHVRDEELSHSLVTTVMNRMLSGLYKVPVNNALKEVLQKGVSCVRAIILSESNWSQRHDATGFKMFSDNIRTFYDSKGVKYLEILTTRLNEWDLVNLMKVVELEMSTSVLVFRFETLQGLAELISKSKDITDLFAGLTTDRDRIMYVDTVSEDNFGQIRGSIQSIARSLRLLAPRMDADIVFETYSSEKAAAMVRERALQMPTLVCSRYDGASRKYLETIVHILNKDIQGKEAKAESNEIIKFLFLLKTPFRTGVKVLTDPGLILVSRGDDTGFGFRSSDISLCPKESDFGGFKDVNDKAPLTVKATIEMDSTASDLLGLSSVRAWTNKWNIVRDMERHVQDETLFMSVAGDSTGTLTSRQKTVVTGFKVTVLVGGMDEFLFGKLVCCCMDGLREDDKNGTQVVIRALLRLVPSIQVATRCSTRLVSGSGSSRGVAVVRSQASGRNQGRSQR